MKRVLILLPILVFFNGILLSQDDQEKKVKKGFGFGVLPAISYDSDLGFQYGALANIYHYGDGSRYPRYNHSLYLEWSRTTKGNGINQIIYDSDRLIPDIRVTAEVAYMTSKALNFYGFNGYKAYYNSVFEDDSEGNEDYISRMFYRLDRKSFRVKADFQGKIIGNKLRWLAGMEYHSTKLGSIDLERLNKGKDDKDKLPDVKGLYDYYVDWGVIKPSEATGGKNAMLKLGLVYDTRDIEANPSRGIWDEVILSTSPQFFGFDEFTVSALLIHRQYFTILPNTLTFAYRLAYRTKLAGTIPHYLLPYMSDTRRIFDAYGGSKTIRGVYRDRIIANGVGLGNLEFRWKFLKTTLFKQNFYIALSSFLDAGRVIDPYQINTKNVPEVIMDEVGVPKYYPKKWLNYNDESLHLSYGAGLHFALNENFIVAVDYGMAANEQDGDSGLYITLNWLF